MCVGGVEHEGGREAGIVEGAKGVAGRGLLPPDNASLDVLLYYAVFSVLLGRIKSWLFL